MCTMVLNSLGEVKEIRVSSLAAGLYARCILQSKICL